MTNLTLEQLQRAFENAEARAADELAADKYNHHKREKLMTARRIRQGLAEPFDDPEPQPAAPEPDPERPAPAAAKQAVNA